MRTLDAWCLALRGQSRTETLTRPKQQLEDAGVTTTEDRVALVEGADLARLPDDAVSLRTWLERLRLALEG